ncbi:mRNA decapping complex subunit 2 (DCP2) [Vairimorpha necatrix]|uniref:mRNA decapping complex subunit 2 (DCP2) n=1 Tax=Vairimorpha necatrix TaxID=6039 RepID=A0AAX4JB96_9MICR
MKNKKEETQKKLNKKKGQNTTLKDDNNVNMDSSNSPCKITEHVLDDLSIRFLLLLDPLDVENIERLFFILEEAHWFYIDNYNIKTIPFIDFCRQILAHNKINIDLMEGINIFRTYKQAIKVYGCIIFDSKLESVLIVRENERINSYGFPKGKKSKDESGLECAIREVKEEIGYDVSNKIIKNFSINLFEKMNFYFVFNVKKSTKFVCNMKNEIMDIIWLPISKLEDGSLGKKFSIITKSYLLWRDLYLSIYDHRFKFNKKKFVDLIVDKTKVDIVN